MIRPLQFVRVLQIYKVLLRHTLNRSVLGAQSQVLRTLSYLNPLSFFKQGKTRGESIRLALESLGPIFVKFGQLLSTRRDLLPEDMILELEKLQDQVPSFPTKIARQLIEQAYGQKIEDLFKTFDNKPLASASIAQVHTATLSDDAEVIVKVLRPNIIKVIRHDIAILYLVAKLVERFWKSSRRLHPVGLVAEFERTIIDELDLLRECANASQLRRNFENSEMMYVPKVYWRFARKNVMVMERIHGVRISDIATLKAHHVDLKKLAKYGVEIFFTQVFRDSFFHADMHPGNVFVDIHDPENPKYIGVDFGIMGSLSPSDQHYIAENLLAFFVRDYRKVALLHIESKWVPAQTRVDQFESAIRTVSEPIFEKPLKDISFGQLLLKLFQTAERFQMEVQPQLMLLQKTLLTIESLGRELYPDLDLWTTAKPFMVNWMKKQYGLKSLTKEILADWPQKTHKLLQTPQLFFDVLQEVHSYQHLARSKEHFERLETKPKTNSKRPFLLGVGLTLLAGSVIKFIVNAKPVAMLGTWPWVVGGAGVLLLIIGWAMPKQK